VRVGLGGQLARVVSVSSMSKSTTRTPRASRSASGFNADDLRDALALRSRHEQAALRAAPSTSSAVRAHSCSTK
jgi:hypothetical protein